MQVGVVLLFHRKVLALQIMVKTPRAGWQSAWPVALREVSGQITPGPITDNEQYPGSGAIPPHVGMLK